ncbi:DUF1858 domain-containing protein [Kosmotoga pacifica]|uniref:DUF1858 domain-containing protein n=1 Tax=Kosmotoga pacifica TaxID=1330330 RepID=A0A0G2ZFC4_9BACT|nr:DUF1858 domain-containing protein [Kosmotoga pacifica]AKI97468.1 hypothetical protein IX53_06135 [Kosmotoga pacifica]
MIEKSMKIEEIVEKYPYLIDFFFKEGLKVMVCGDILWGTLEEEAFRQGKGDRIDEIVTKANEIIAKEGEKKNTFLNIGDDENG